MPHPPSLRRFRLTRYFSLTSLVGVVAVTACLIGLYGQLTLDQLVEHEERANADLTRALSNAIWSRYRLFVAAPPGRTRTELLADPAQVSLRADVLHHMKGLNIAKVKIYDLRGLTVFSTDPSQIGEDKGTNPGLRRALEGGSHSQITYRERFDAFEGTLNRRSLRASYVPARTRAEGPVEGVFEVYSDVTHLLARQRRAKQQVAGAVLLLLGTLYLFLLAVVRKADRVLAEQARQRADGEAQARHLASHDLLTGLPNRLCFGERFAPALAHAARHGRRCALMFVDLDGFKGVNDRLGHAAGDAALRELAARMQACVRQSDVVFRMGGDEFTVLLPEIVGPDDTTEIAQRIVTSVAEPLWLQGQRVAVGASVGIAVYPEDGTQPDTLLRNADAAMYAAKEGGRGRHLYWRPAMAGPVRAPAAETAGA